MYMTLMLVLSERIHFYNALNGDVDRYFALAELLSQAELTRSLISEENFYQDKDKKVYMAPVRFPTFIGIPIDSSSSKYFYIPD